MNKKLKKKEGSLILTQSEEKFLKEYELTQQMAIHYDTMNWQIGSIMCAGLFVGMGVIGTNIKAYLPFSILSFFILFMWNLFYKRHRKIQLRKWDRLQELEEKLEFKQHLKVENDDNGGELSGLKSITLLNLFTFIFPALMLLIYILNRFGIFYLE